MGFIHVYSSINQPTWKSLEAKQGSMGQMKGWFIISQSLWGTWMKWNPQWSGLVEELLKSQSNVPKSNGFEPVHKNNTTHLVSTFFFWTDWNRFTSHISACSASLQFYTSGVSTKNYLPMLGRNVLGGRLIYPQLPSGKPTYPTLGLWTACQGLLQ